MLTVSVEYDAKKLLKAFKKVRVYPTVRRVSDH